MKLNHADMLKSECRIYDVTAYSMREEGITEYDYEKEKACADFVDKHWLSKGDYPVP